jgi:hypothetical protein
MALHAKDVGSRVSAAPALRTEFAQNTPRDTRTSFVGIKERESRTSTV